MTPPQTTCPTGRTLVSRHEHRGYRARRWTVTEESGSRSDRRDPRVAHRRLRRPVRRASYRDGRLRDPSSVRRRVEARGGLARRRHAVRHGPSPRRRRRARRRPGRAGAARSRSSTAPARATRTCASRSATSCALEGIEAGPDDVVVTVGSQQALDLITRIFIDPGDVVLAEGPSYVGALGTFAAYQAKVVHIAMDDRGAHPRVASRETIAALERAGAAIKFLYTIPTFQNPAGVTLNAARRHAGAGDLPASRAAVVEDNPYGLLGFDGEPHAGAARRRRRRRRLPRLVLQDARPRLPGRLGARPARHPRQARAGRWSRPCCRTPRFTQLAVGQYLATQPWREQIKTFRELYRERRDAMLDVAGGAHARRLHLDPPGRRLLRLG